MSPKLAYNEWLQKKCIFVACIGMCVQYQLNVLPHLRVSREWCLFQQWCQPASLQKTNHLHLSSLTGNQILPSCLVSWSSTASRSRNLSLTSEMYYFSQASNLMTFSPSLVPRLLPSFLLHTFLHSMRQKAGEEPGNEGTSHQQTLSITWGAQHLCKKLSLFQFLLWKSMHVVYGLIYQPCLSMTHFAGCYSCSN